jgi:hypothetical protein
VAESCGCHYSNGKHVSQEQWLQNHERISVTPFSHDGLAVPLESTDGCLLFVEDDDEIIPDGLLRRQIRENGSRTRLGASRGIGASHGRGDLGWPEDAHCRATAIDVRCSLTSATGFVSGNVPFDGVIYLHLHPCRRLAPRCPWRSIVLYRYLLKLIHPDLAHRGNRLIVE